MGATGAEGVPLLEVVDESIRRVEILGSELFVSASIGFQSKYAMIDSIRKSWSVKRTYLSINSAWILSHSIVSCSSVKILLHVA
jgi:hypothetical protein